MLDHFAENYSRETKDNDWALPDWDAEQNERERLGWPRGGWHVTLVPLPWIGEQRLPGKPAHLDRADSPHYQTDSWWLELKKYL